MFTIPHVCKLAASRALDTMQVAFSWFDYGFFVAMLSLCVLVGLYFGCCRQQDGVNEYLLGGKKMAVVPIAISLVASNISGITLLGLPTDVYRFGGTLYMYVTMLPLVYLITYYVYLPVFHKMQLVSVYEYMMLRFDRKIRLLTSGLSTLSALLYLPIVVYIPALALAQAAQINLHLVTFALCVVCMFYTTIGGLRAVVWTDALQFFVMMGSIIGVFCKGLASVGSFREMWARAVVGRRLEFDLDVNPIKRDTVLATAIGSLFGCLSYVSIGQSFVQKYLSMRTRKDSKKLRALLLFTIGTFTIFTFMVLTGLIIYARYYDCDPLSAGKIHKHDEILPFYVMDVASSIPGLAGLFLSGIFSAALSTMSACMNCLAGSVYVDFVSPFMPRDLGQKRVSEILKLLVIVIGTISTAMVFVIEHMGSILPINYALSGITNGPLLGLFTLGMLFPIANSKGAMAGGFASIALMTCIIVGGQYNQVINDQVSKPMSTQGCPNGTLLPPHVSPLPSVDKSHVFILFRLTHYYYCFVGTIVTIFIGLLVSFCTRKESDEKVHPDLISPLSVWVAQKFGSNAPAKAKYAEINRALQVLRAAGEQ